MRQGKVTLAFLLSVLVLLSFVGTCFAAPDAGTSPATAAKFTDVQTDSWYYDSVNKIFETGIMNGISEEIFAPNSTLTREQFVKVIYSAFFKDEILPINCSFSDVAANSWSAPYIQFAKEKNITTGIGDNKFGPQEPLTREMACTMLVKVLKIKYNLQDIKTIPELTFADAAAVSDWAKESVAEAYKLGIVKGVGENNFAPKKTITRAETATLIVNYINNATDIEAAVKNDYNTASDNIPIEDPKQEPELQEVSGAFEIVDVIEGVSKGFSVINLSGLDEAKYFNVLASGVKISSEPVSVNEKLVGLPLLFSQPDKLEVNFYSNESGTDPIATATLNSDGTLKF